MKTAIHDNKKERRRRSSREDRCSRSVKRTKMREVKPVAFYFCLWIKACVFLLLSSGIFLHEHFPIFLHASESTTQKYIEVGTLTTSQNGTTVKPIEGGDEGNPSLCCFLAEFAVGIMAFYCFRYILWCHCENQSHPISYRL